MTLFLALALLQDSPEALLGRLEATDVVEREQAERDLLRRGEEVLPLLRSRLHHPDPEIRARIRFLTTRIAWEAVLDPGLLARVAPLRQAVNRGDAAVFLEAAARSGLLGMGTELGLEAWLYQNLDHADPKIRRNVLHNLANLRMPARQRRPLGLLARLIAEWTPEAWEDPKGERLGELALLAASLAVPLHLPEIAPWKESTSDAAPALRLLRAVAGDAEAAPGLIDLLKDSTSPLREAALEAVRRLRYAPARKDLLTLFGRTGCTARAHWALDAVVDDGGEREVVEMLSKLPPDQRGGNLAYLVLRKRWSSAAPLYVEVLRTCTPDRWTDAAKTLAALGATEAFDPIFQEYSRNGFSHTGGQPEGAPKKMDYQVPYAMFALADGPGAVQLLARLDREELRDRNLVAGMVGNFRHPEARTAAWRRFDREERPELRRQMLTSFRGNPDLPAFEKIARSTSDPLAPLAAAYLLQLRGKEALGLAEAVARRAELLPDELLGAFSHDPPAGLVDVVGRSAERSQAGLALLARIGTNDARKELDRLRRDAATPAVRHAATSSLMRLERKALPEIAGFVKLRQGYYFWADFQDLLRADAPGFRDALRQDVRTRGLETMLFDLKGYAERDWIPELRAILAGYDADRFPDLGKEALLPMMCSTGQTRDHRGLYALQALAATGDRALVPLFLDRLGDPEARLQAFAARIAGRWKITDAEIPLRRLARRAIPEVREAAIDALSRLAAPGTAEFLRSLFNDSPMAVAPALARLGVDLRPELSAFYAYEEPSLRVRLAVERMAHSKAYEGLERPVDGPRHLHLADLPGLATRVLGLPVRFSAKADAARRSGPYSSFEIPADAEGADLFERHSPVFHDGAIELRLPEEQP